MRNLISEEYKQLNSDLHASNPLFGSKAYKQAENVVNSLGLTEGDVLLDYGCGKGSLGHALKPLGIRVVGYDPALKMFEKHPSEYEEYPFKYVSCMDVLEHVEPAMIKDVLRDLNNCYTDKAFVLISTVASNKKLADGRNAHLIIQGVHWWLDRLEEAGFVLEEIVDKREGWLGVLCTK